MPPLLGSASPDLLTAQRYQAEPSVPPPKQLGLQPRRCSHNVNIVGGAFISARAQIGNVTHQPTHVWLRELLDGESMIGSWQDAHASPHHPCTWILRTIKVARRGGTGSATICCDIVVEGFCQIYVHSSAQSDKQNPLPYNA